MRKLLLLPALVLFVVLDGCSLFSVEYPSSTFQSGPVVLEQSTQAPNQSSISYYDTNAKRVFNNIYFAQNGGQLGNATQSIKIYNGRMYITMPATNQIMVLNAGTMNPIGYIQKGAQGNVDGCRYMVSTDPSTMLVTCWGSNGSQPSVAVVNLNTLQVTANIPVPANPEYIIASRGIAYIAHTDLKELTVINLKKSLPIMPSPISNLPGFPTGGLAIDGNNKLWVLCNSQNAGNATRLLNTYTIPTDTISTIWTLTRQLRFDTLPANTVFGNLTVNRAGNALYFTRTTAGAGAFLHSFSAKTLKYDTTGTVIIGGDTIGLRSPLIPARPAMTALQCDPNFDLMYLGTTAPGGASTVIRFDVAPSFSTLDTFRVSGPVQGFAFPYRY